MLVLLTLAVGAIDVESVVLRFSASASYAELSWFMCWIAGLYSFTVWAVLRQERKFGRDFAMLLTSLLLYFFAAGVYGTHIVQTTNLFDASAFMWVPIAQWVWVGGWFYALARKA